MDHEATIRTARELDAEQVRTQWRDDMIALADAADAESKAIERKSTAPVQVAEVEC